ncbi:uncharacterized protein LOC111344407, partial [Stylophora pistillata]
MAFTVPTLHNGHLVRFFFLNSFAISCLGVQRNSYSYDNIVKEARCTAKCYTQVTPHFINGIEGKSTTETSSAPVPPDGELMVQNLTTVGKFVEREQSNTFAVNVSWEPPSFKYRRVTYYNVSCHSSGYPRDEFRSYSKTNLQRTSIRIAAILPRQLVNIEVTPFYNDKYITGKSKKTVGNAPGPRTDLVKVVGLSRNELMPSSDESFRTTVFWQKPLFNHSVVQYYRYRISNTSSETVGKKKRRAIDLNTDLTT